MLECAAASAAQTKLRATEGAQLRLKTNVRRNGEFLLSKRRPINILGRFIRAFKLSLFLGASLFISCASAPEVVGLWQYSNLGTLELKQDGAGTALNGVAPVTYLQSGNTVQIQFLFLGADCHWTLEDDTMILVRCKGSTVPDPGSCNRIQ